MLRLVPPAGAPLGAAQLVRAARAMLSPNHHDQAWRAALRAHAGVNHVFGAGSGRAALWLVLKSLQALRPGRSVVALPAYTCFSVPAVAVRLGLRVQLLDIDPETLAVDPAQAEAIPDDALLCILSANLFGMVQDMSPLRSMADAKGAFLVDDAAQALGAIRNGSPAGTLGHVGFYSLARGKALALGEGGLIVTESEEIAGALQSKIAALTAPSPAHSAWLFLQVLLSWPVLQPELYWILNAMPFLRLGLTEFDPSFPTRRLSKLPRALLPLLLGDLAGLNAVRSGNADFLMQALAGHRGFFVPRPSTDCRPTYIRLPVVARDETLRRRAIEELRAAGIGASAFYPSAICDIPQLESHMATPDFHRPCAETLSRRMLTLPTHPQVRRRDLERMVEILHRLDSEA